MLSGEFTRVPISSIVVDRDNRVRREITREAHEAMVASIEKFGLLHPLVVKRDGTLVSGETRLTALEVLGWELIPVQYLDTLSEDEALALELEENVKRTNLPWQDQCDAVKKFHELKLKTEASWTQDQSAAALGMSATNIRKYIAVQNEIERGNPLVKSASKLSVAVGIASRQAERRITDAIASIAEVEAVPVEAAPIEVADFKAWAPLYDGPPFNFIHCDFPYGIGADKFDQSAAESRGGYDDSENNYWSLVDCLISNRDRLMGDSCHILFWFSLNYYTETVGALREAGFWVDRYPLIWHKSDNTGVLPDPNRGPRRIYETALLCSWGDRKIVKAVSNLFSAPVVRAAEHMSEKSEAMLGQFFRMLVDSSTRLLDPTCGSGSALRAAHKAGAGSVLGLEISPEYADLARKAWHAK